MQDEQSKSIKKALMTGFISWWILLFFQGFIFYSILDTRIGPSLTFTTILSIIISFIVYNRGIKESAVVIAQTAKQTKKDVADVIKEADKRVGIQKEIKTEEDAYEIASEELDEDLMVKGIWAKAFSDAEGDEKKQKALYIKYRAAQLIKDIK